MTNTTSTAAAPRRSFGQLALVAGLGILGVLFFVAAILFITGAANHIHFLSGGSHHGVHEIRLAVSIVAGVLLLAAAGYVSRSSSKSLRAVITRSTGASLADSHGQLTARSSRPSLGASSLSVTGVLVCPLRRWTLSLAR